MWKAAPASARAPISTIPHEKQECSDFMEVLRVVCSAGLTGNRVRTIR
jgi:hypothetical protein